MNGTFRSFLIVGMLAVTASAQEPAKSQFALSMKDVATAMGPKTAIQPVFTGDGIKGWRIYGTSDSSQLVAQSIAEGSLMTRVCGVSARDVRLSGGTIYCPLDVAREFEVTFQIADKEKKVLIRRQ